MIHSRVWDGAGRSAGIRPAVRTARPRGRRFPVVPLALALVLASVMSLCMPEAPEAPGAPVPRTALAAAPGLRLGDSGQDVAWAQLRLAGLGCFRGTATGYFGPVTKAAVEKYQRQAGLAVSGVLGPQTARRLAGTTWEVQVSRGDTLEAIAARYRLSLPEILDANPRIVNPDRIYAGQSVVIPGTAGILRIAGVEPSPASVPASGGGLSPVPAQSSQGQDKPASGGETQTIPPGAAALLTFNDGPDPDVLPRVLEILRRNNCRAVFFFCGEQMEQHPDLVKTASAQGHSIQSHGWRHEPLGALPETRITAELDATSRLIAGLTGKSPAFFRPPEGVMNEAIQMSARRTGQQIVGWQNIGALPDGPATVGRLDRWLTQRTVIMLPGADPATAGYLQALLDRWMAAGVQMLKPEDLGLMPVVW